MNFVKTICILGAHISTQSNNMQTWKISEIQAYGLTQVQVLEPARERKLKKFQECSWVLSRRRNDD